jgi:uncharacterized protein with FMN-binding domain
LTLGGTVAGIAVLVAVKYQPAASSIAGAGTVAPPAGAMLAQGMPATPSDAVAAAGTGKKAPSGEAKPHATPKPSATVTPKASGTGGTGKSTAARTITGAVVSTQYGPMQVQATLAGSRITSVTVLQETNMGSLSGQIDAMAIPKLTAEALAAQSAKIDAVSGASYTSQGYIQSLQSALDKAGA